MQSPGGTTTPHAAAGSPALRNAAQRSTIDEVITLFAPTGGPTRASLTFRVGTADEPLALRGINHLIGHVAAASAGRTERHCPVSVSASVTTFHITGNALAVANELGAICHWLSSTATGGTVDGRLLEPARRAAEDDASPHAPEHATLLRHRFGASGWGSAAFDELGLARCDAATVADWVRRFFVRGNAVLALSGTKATTLRLPLPPGDAVPLPVVPAVVHPIPGLVTSPTPLLSIGAAIPTQLSRLDRDRAHAGLTSEIMRSRAAYAARKRFPDLKVAGSPMAIGDELVHVALSADVTAETEAKVLDIVLESLEVLHNRHLVGGELKAHVNRRLAAYDRAASTAEGAHAMLHRQALGALQERPWSLALERRILSSADESAVNEQLDAACAGLLVQVADDDPPIRPWPGTPEASQFEPTGSPQLSLPAYGADPQAMPRRIQIDESGVTVRTLAGAADPPERRQLAWADLRIAQIWDDGHVLLIPEHGRALEVSPEDWRDPDTVHTQLTSHIPDETVVPMGPRDTPPSAGPRLTDRVPPVAWLVAVLGSLVTLGCAIAPIWSDSLDVLRWVLGAVAVAVLALGVWQYAEVRRTDRRFAQHPE